MRGGMKQQLFKTSSPDIANGRGMETETDVQSGQVAWGIAMLPLASRLPFRVFLLKSAAYWDRSRE